MFVKLGAEDLARDKHSSLLRKLENYGRKKFYNIDSTFTKTVSESTQKKVLMHQPRFLMLAWKGQLLNQSSIIPWPNVSQNTPEWSLYIMYL